MQYPFPFHCIPPPPPPPTDIGASSRWQRWRVIPSTCIMSNHLPPRWSSNQSGPSPPHLIVVLAFAIPDGTLQPCLLVVIHHDQGPANRPCGTGQLDLKKGQFFYSWCVKSYYHFYREMTQNNETHQNMLSIPPAVEFTNIPPTTPEGVQINESLTRNVKPLFQQLMWLSGRPMLLVAEVRSSIPAKHRGWSRR
jgi:hypothetical protein